MSKKTSESDSSFSIPFQIKVFWVVIVSLLLVIHLVFRSIDQVILALLLLLAVPWILQVVESLKLPGGIELKLRIGKLEQTVGDQEGMLKQQQEKLKQQQNLINKIVIFSMSGNIYGHLQRIYDAKVAIRNGEARYVRFDKRNPEVIKELCYLRDNGYIHQFDPNSLSQDQNLAEAVNLTPLGEWYVQLREKAEKS